MFVRKSKCLLNNSSSRKHLFGKCVTALNYILIIHFVFQISEVKDLENRMAEVLDGRAKRIRARRRNDVHDMYDECSAAAAGRPLHQRAPEIAQRAAEREARR